MNRQRFIFRSLLLAVLLGAVFVMAQPVFTFAQQAGLEEAGQAAGLQDTDIRIVIGNFIRIALGFVGIIALLLVMYSGWLWMTAGGNAERVDKAKKTLINGVIGMVLISASYSIASFVVSNIQQATGGSSSGTTTTATDPTGGVGSGGTRTIVGGTSADGFSVLRYRPEGTVAIRNVRVDVSFSRRLDEASVIEDALQVANAATGEVVPGTVSMLSNRLTFIPSSLCPSPNEDRRCLDANTPYTITVSPALLSTRGEELDCAMEACTATFTTGSLVDTQSPVATILFPDDGSKIEPGSVAFMQVSARDDSEIATGDFFAGSEFIDSVAAQGENLSNVLIESEWNTSGFADNTQYRLSVTVTDIAGNEDADSVRVRINPAHCYNNQIDSALGESGPDCGGDCGSCDGAVCAEDLDCSTGSCLEGACTTLPNITSVSPDNGAPGSFVRIAGEHFGSVTGRVVFPGALGGTVDAEIPACSEGWDSEEIVVAVPEGAGDGAITVVTSRELEDGSNDERGPLAGEYDVNTTERPALCKLSPSIGRSGNSVTLIGENFGDVQGASTISFGNTPVTTYQSWSDRSVTVTVPTRATGVADVKIAVQDVDSNVLRYTVQRSGTLREGAIGGSTGTGTGSGTGTGTGGSTGGSGTGSGSGTGTGTGTGGTTGGGSGTGTGSGSGTGTGSGSGSGSTVQTVPEIGFLSPENASIGQILTVTGSDFGTQTGTVRFEHRELGYTAIGSTDLPEECAETLWGNTQITVIVPDKFTNNESVVAGTYNLFVVRQDGAVSDVQTITITSASPAPGICAVLPSSGESGDEVTIIGTNLGSAEGNVTFYNNVSAEVTDWSQTRISATVPEAASTGPIVAVSAAGIESNRLNFTIGASGTVEQAAGQKGGYAWSFSTGLLPRTPQLIVACDRAVVSAVPNERFTDFACVNAQVYGEFSTVMDDLSLIEGETIIAEECFDADCTRTEPVDGELRLSSSSTATNFSWLPDASYNDGLLKGNTTYRVTVTTGALSKTGTPLLRDVSWEFVTGAEDQDCAVSEVRVRPQEETLNEAGARTEFTALPVTNDCQILSSDASTWTWDIDESFAAVFEGTCALNDSDSCAVTEAIAEGETTVTATEDASGVGGSGTLTIEFTDPYVSSVYPDCTEACSNAAVGARFNIAMDRSIERAGAVQLFSCANELCLSYTGMVSNTATCVFEPDGTSCKTITFDLPSSLETGRYFRAVISGSNTSASGVPLTRTNFGEDYSFLFRTKRDNAVCGVSRIELNPTSAVLRAVGATQNFTVTTFGEPDTCSVAGQTLDAFAYQWDWEDPIVDVENVAEWVKLDGRLLDRNKETIPNGCTASCTAVGSTAVEAICGNARIERGEECEDGNIVSGDGCSSSCLYEGSAGTAFCGNNVVDVGSPVFEECDDGNIENGDGCSASCLNEGSRVIGAECGNGDVAHDSVKGGEDCDDGNKRGGDGCSAVCLNEGSANTVAVAAVCGDGIITSPYETCDDTNLTNGDGCSSRCLHEGGTPETCGNGAIDVKGTGGEQCDDGNDEDGDGCSSRCLLEGASLSYATPSVCGDGIVGTGELFICEAGGGPDSKVDPVQVARITEAASLAVDPESRFATSTIRVSTPDFAVNGSAELQLACVAKTDADCPDPANYGVAKNSCCMPRPQVALYPNGENTCLNTQLYAEFDQQMDTATLAGNMYVKMNIDDSIACPENYEVFTGDLALTQSQHWLARAIRTVKSFLIGKTNAQELGDCLLPITSINQRASEGGLYRVDLRTNVLLEPNREYELVIKAATGEEGVGARSLNGVSLSEDISARFRTTEGICTLDRIEVKDQDLKHPNFFTGFEESHDFVANTYSFTRGNKQAISSIPGVYEWTWDSWTEDSEGVVVAVQSEFENTSVVAAQQESGKATVVAQATVTTGPDVAATEGENTVSGTAQVETVVCERPWPAYEQFPFIDDATGTVPGTTEGSAWMNFSTYFCRDAGLSDVTVIAPPKTETPSILKEYIFKVNNGSGDAIGFRIASNPRYLSPAAWYRDQGFAGNPQPLTVDGFEAIQDGRTVYIAAPNRVEGATAQLYANIYIFSHNEGASSNTVSIFNEMIENLRFLTNVPSVAMCHDGDEYTGQRCSSDFDCNSTFGETCQDAKAKLTRDTKRIADMLTLSSTVNAYGSRSGLCSVTTSLSCTSDAACPGDEVCKPSFPTLPAGTFVRSLAASTWPSWSETLGATLGSTLPVDPLNRAIGCGVDDLLAYNNVTCVDEAKGAYICPLDSFAYHYRSIGPFFYEIDAELEYKDADWATPVDTFAGYDIRLGGNMSASVGGFTGGPAFCSASTYGASGICGDGVVGGDEVCEIGEQGSRQLCDADGDSVANDGTIAQTCNATCSGFVTPTGSACVAFTCGNGVKETGEECDDGSFNGRYGFCGNDCSYGTSFYCGDGSVAGGELCDCGVTTPDGRTIGGGSCTVVNGTYTANPGNSCSWDCRVPAPFCGDNIVQSGEQCDGTVDTWSGKLCRSSIRFGTNAGEPCETNAQCGGAACGGGGGKFEACPLTTVCVEGDAAKLGLPCGNNFECDSLGKTDGVCSSTPIQTTRTRTCADDGASGELCTWQSKWSNITCRAELLCGNGRVDEGESCDDGNKNNTDGCTNACKANVCGDGFVYQGVESCDEGLNNGQICTAAHGSTCNYCSLSCRTLAASGSFCGDGVKNGAEYCDAGDVPYTLINSSTSEAVGTCTAAQEGAKGGGIYCASVGVCNGGTDNGAKCTTTSGLALSSCPGGGVCSFPDCADNCKSTCPDTFASSTLLMKTNQLGSSRSSSIELADFDAERTPSASGGFVANAAEMYFPACDVATSIVADVASDSSLEEVYVSIIFDLSKNMQFPANYITIGGTTSPTDQRMKIAKEVSKNVIDRLYAELGSNVYIGIGTFGSGADTKWEMVSEPVCNTVTTGWCPPAGKAKLFNKIDALTPGSSTAEITSEGYRLAQRHLSNPIPDTARRVAIVYTPVSPVSGYDPSTVATEMKSQGMELYALTMTNSPQLINQAARWSSGNPNAETGTDYAHNGWYTNSFRNLYDIMVDSLKGFTFGFVVNGQVVSNTIRTGNNISLPWPTGIACDPNRETTIPIRVQLPNNLGTVRISNPRVNMCTP